MQASRGLGGVVGFGAAHVVGLLDVQVAAWRLLLVSGHQHRQLAALLRRLRQWTVRVAFDAQIATLKSRCMLRAFLAQRQLLRFHQLVVLPPKRVKSRQWIVFA